MIWKLWHLIFPKPHAMHINKDGIIRYAYRKPIRAWAKRKVKGWSKKKIIPALILLPFLATSLHAQSSCVAGSCVNAFIKGINLPAGNPAIPVNIVNISTPVIVFTTQTVPVSIAQVVTVTPSTNAFSINGISYYRTDSYAAPGNGLTINVSSSPLRTFAIQVDGIGGPATSWDVRFEGSLNGLDFTELLRHTDLIGDRIALFSGTSMQPVLFIRSRCVALVLGAASSINVTILGVQ